MYVEGIILNCISQIKANRSIFGIYHLLTGKKSIQSVHDAHIFQLEKFYGVYQSLSRHHFSEIINGMKEKDWIERVTPEDFYQMTELGKVQLAHFQKSALYSQLNGLGYTGKDAIFIERLYLLVQTYSNIQANNYSFIPIVDNQDIAKWVKVFYKKNQTNTISAKLYHELFELLSIIGDHAAEFLVNRLSGYKHYGMSIDQLAKYYQLSRDDTVIYLTYVTHHLIFLIEQNKEAYPIMSLLINDLEKHKFITNTANQTYQLLNNHFSMQEIAKKRNLKLNTIYDHIVEIALYDKDFSIQMFVSTGEQKEIIAAIQRNKTYKLKIIKESCGDSVSYFQIRLVLARLKELLPGEEINV
jgi:uncharacterized protein YpbB